MKITVNGESKELSDGRTVAELVREMGLAGRAVAVEVNQQVVPKRQHAEATLRDGDVVELVTLVGGG